MSRLPRDRRPRAHLVTEAQQSKSQDISNRERRYLIMMAIRVACFLAAILLFARGGRWFSLIPAVGAVVIPYFAVVFANGGREPAKSRGLADYQPEVPPGETRSLPGRAAPPHIVGHVTYDNDHASAAGSSQDSASAEQAYGPEPNRNAP